MLRPLELGAYVLFVFDNCFVEGAHENVKDLYM